MTSDQLDLITVHSYSLLPLESQSPLLLSDLTLLVPFRSVQGVALQAKVEKQQQ
jgi:hypothetical protein